MSSGSTATRGVGVIGVYGSAPKAPDPQETAAAQTATNVSTAIANSYLGNINQVTPDGSLTYSQTGKNFINDKNGQNYWVDAKGNYTTNDPGKNAKGYTQTQGYYAPTFTATQTLSQPQQAIKNQEDQANLNFAALANTQSGKLNNLLADPFSINGAPAAGQASSLKAPSYQQFGSGPQLQNSIGNTGSIQNSIAGAGGIQSGVANAGAIGNTIADAGNIQTSLGNAGDITRSYGTEYGSNVQEVQNALMARLQPSLDQNRSSLEQKLANQGLQPGSEAYNRAIDSASRQENDARYGAILNAGQEQSRLAGLAQNQAAFQNSAQQQAYSQQLGAGQFANAAQAQQYGQNANNLQVSNAAQAQQYGQNAQSMQLGNAAQQQQFTQNAALASFGNDAQAQQYAQALQNAQFGNTANQQMYQNANTATGANNALQDQSFNAQQAMMNAQNTQRANYLNEQYALRNQQINEPLSLASGAQLSSPNFVPTQGQNIPTVDYAGLVNQGYQNQLAAYQQKQAGIGSLLGGVGSLLTLSDKTAKKDIKEVGALKGHKLYEYRYKGKHDDGKKHIGVMAQDAAKKRPDAVSTGEDGLKRVDYGRLFSAKGGKN